MRCFERLGHGELSPDEAIKQSRQAIASESLLTWTMPLALGLWMNERYYDAFDALQQPGVESACGHLAYFHILLGMVARQIDGKHQLGPGRYSYSFTVSCLL